MSTILFGQQTLEKICFKAKLLISFDFALKSLSLKRNFSFSSFQFCPLHVVHHSWLKSFGLDPGHRLRQRFKHSSGNLPGQT
jgi:hypothetical protein